MFALLLLQNISQEHDQIDTHEARQKLKSFCKHAKRAKDTNDFLVFHMSSAHVSAC